MSGRAFLRAMAGRLREALLGSNRSGGDPRRPGAHAATGSQTRTRATQPGETGRAQGRAAQEDGGRASGGAKGAYGGDAKGPYSGGPKAYGSDAKGGDKVPYSGGPSGAYGTEAKGKGPYESPYSGIPKAKGAYGGGAKGTHSRRGGANGGPGGGYGGKGRRGRSDARGEAGVGDDANPHGWWKALTTRMKKMVSETNWGEVIQEVETQVEQAERARRLGERMHDLGTWLSERLVAAGTAVVVTYMTVSDKVQTGTAAAKAKVLEMKEAVKEKLSPNKGESPKGPAKEDGEVIVPKALDFSA